ncbi:hypothetical protein [Rhodopseudomonas telluris]|uniref:Uncharacterized protein n=1 Tax=Rhodopseudomonas telluris TaxID=644215 RepID=A0ABV6EZP3_9BRAD
MKRSGWDAAFDPPIELPEGGSLKTLRDAADYIQRLPAAEQQHEKVQTALHVLLQAADHNGLMCVTCRRSRHLHFLDDTIHRDRCKRPAM